MATPFLAIVLGWYMVVFGLLVLIRRKQFGLIMTNILKHQESFFILALLTFTIGLLMVVSHNLWVMAWPVVITLLSWLILISGIIRLFFPEAIAKKARSLKEKPWGLIITALVILCIGIYLLVMVYFFY